MEFKLLTWNVHGLPAPLSRERKRRIGAVAEALRREKPDFIMLQELWLDSDADYFRQTMVSYSSTQDDGRALPVEPWTPVIGQLALPLGAFFQIRRSGLLTLVSADWEIIEQHPFHFGHEACDMKFWEMDGQGDKGFQVVRARRRTDNAEIVLINTHLQSRYSWNSYDSIRTAQIGELNAYAATISADLPVVMAGDFNLADCCAPGGIEGSPCNEPVIYGELTKMWNDLTASTRKACGACGSPECITNYGDADWIDYILARRSDRWTVNVFDPVQMLRNQAQDVPYSDHHGLVAHLEVKAAPRIAGLPTAAAAVVWCRQSTRRQWLAATAVLCASALPVPRWLSSTTDEEKVS